MAFVWRTLAVFRDFRRLWAGFAFLTWALISCAGAHAAGEVAVIDEARRVQDITENITAVFAPGPADENGFVARPGPRTLAFDDPYSGWAILTVQNPSRAPALRVLVFSYPALERATLLGAKLAVPRLSAIRMVEGEEPQLVGAQRSANRFAMLRVELEPGASATYVFQFAGGDGAISAQIWEPEALQRFDKLVLLTLGLYWGILFVGTALMFAMRILSSGPAMMSGGFLALAALVFEGASFGFGGSGLGMMLAQGGIDAGGVMRVLSLVLVSFCGLDFLRKLLMLREEAPLTDLILRGIQYSLIAACVLVFWPGLGPAGARLVAAIALVVSGATVWHARRTLPDAFQLVPPGWFFLVASAIGAIAVSALELHLGPVVELLLHGFFVIGIMLLVFSAAVRATVPAGFFEFGTDAAPAFSAPAPTTALVPVREDVPETSEAVQGLWDWNIADERLYVSPSVEQMMGLSEGALRGKESNWFARILEADRPIYRETIQHYLQQGNSSFAVEFRIRHESGGMRWFQLRATGLAGQDGQGSRVIGIVTDITSAKTAEEQLLREASLDALTGLANRASLISHLNWAITSYHEQPLVDPATQDILAPVLIVLDLSGFEAVNEELGHAAGDELLKEIARRIEKALSNTDILARIGADEFAILMTPEAGDRGRPASMRDPSEMTELLADLFAQPMTLAGRIVRPAANVAHVRIDEHHRQAQDVLTEAERALRRSRRRENALVPASPSRAPAISGGKLDARPAPEPENGLRRFERSVKSSFGAKPPSSLEDELRAAIHSDQIKIVYEPIVSLADRRLAGFAALTRWQHPERGDIAPAEFMPIAEASGLIVALGRFALSMAAMQLGQWQGQFALRRPLFVTVDVSGRQLLAADFARDVSEVLQRVKLAPGSLRLALGERTLLGDNPQVAARLDTIKSKGLGIALSDFGQAHPDLARMKALPIGTVKIDGELVANAGKGGRSDTALRSAIAMAHDMKLGVIAEGLATEIQAMTLLKFGCDYAQGELVSAALSPQDAQRLIAAQSKQEAAKPGKSDKA